MRKLCGIAVVLIGVLTLAGIAGGAPSEPKTLVAVLSGECPQAAENWRGVAIFHVNDDGTIDYKIVANNIDEAVIAGHIHFLPPGAERGPVFIDLHVTAEADAHGIVTEGTISATQGAALLAGIAAGNDYYVNLHTATCLLPLGAVRGALQTAAAA